MKPLVPGKRITALKTYYVHKRRARITDDQKLVVYRHFTNYPDEPPNGDTLVLIGKEAGISQ